MPQGNCAQAPAVHSEIRKRRPAVAALTGIFKRE